jgi:hypothetical protein
MIDEKRTSQLLNDLCVNLGFCLPPSDIARLTKDPPDSVSSFTDAVFLAEGLDPETADRRLYRQVRDAVADAFRRAEDARIRDESLDR